MSAGDQEGKGRAGKTSIVLSTLSREGGVTTPSYPVVHIRGVKGTHHGNKQFRRGRMRKLHGILGQRWQGGSRKKHHLQSRSAKENWKEREMRKRGAEIMAVLRPRATSVIPPGVQPEVGRRTNQSKAESEQQAGRHRVKPFPSMTNAWRALSFKKRDGKAMS